MDYRKRKIPPRPVKRPGIMNRTEANYAQFLEIMRRTGEILGWRYEPVKFRLAPNTYYNPDFQVIYEDRVEFHEIKGFMRDDALVKFKCCAELYPEFGWKMIRFERGGWTCFMEF